MRLCHMSEPVWLANVPAFKLNSIHEYVTKVLIRVPKSLLMRVMLKSD